MNTVARTGILALALAMLGLAFRQHRQLIRLKRVNRLYRRSFEREFRRACPHAARLIGEAERLRPSEFPEAFRSFVKTLDLRGLD